jgi:predicted ATPase
LIPARHVANDLLRLAQASNDREIHLVSNRAMGTCLCHLGECALSVEYLERALSYYRPKTHNTLASVAGYDARVSALNWLAIDLFVLGQPDQAASRIRESLAWSRQLRHPHSLCFSLGLAAILSLLRRTDHGVMELLTELDAVSTEQRFPYWLATAQIIHGHMLSEDGNAAKGLKLIQKGLSGFKAIGSAWMQTYFFALLAQSFEQAGQANKALTILTTALETTQRTGECWYVSELHRARGEWFLAHSCEELANVELCFASALAIAKQHNAKMWELRAATSLARLWRDQGKRTEARDLLAPVYNWFTEGLDTPVLTEAKGLLESLH